MSTRSYIGVQNQDGSIVSIYCHFDGYPEGVGATLLQSWTDPDRLHDLMGLGDLSILGSELGEQHDFDQHSRVEEQRTWCLAYGRDRGEQNVAAHIYPTQAAFLDGSYHHSTDYTYLYRPDDLGQPTWYVRWEGMNSPFFRMEPKQAQDFRLLTEVLQERADWQPAGA